MATAAPKTPNVREATRPAIPKAVDNVKFVADPNTKSDKLTPKNTLPKQSIT